MKKILVVDDEETCLFFLSSCLEAENYDVRTAATGNEAIEIYKNFMPDLLITDWMLKDGIDGVEVAEELLKITPDLKIVFITGMAAEVIKERIKNINYISVIEKPIELDHILKIVGNHT